MKFRIVTARENKGIFTDLFRANRILFNKVTIEGDEQTVTFTFVPRTVLALNPIQEVLRSEREMETEFNVVWVVD